MEQVKVRKLFTETEKVVKAYKERVSKLDDQEAELNAELSTLQDELTANILDQETAGVAELVYLKVAAKEINHKTEIIQVLLEELAEERKALKLEFTPIYRTAIQKDRGNKAGYGATEIVEKYKFLMLTEISDIGAQMQEQYRKIAPDILEVFDDEAVRPKFFWDDNSISPKSKGHLLEVKPLLVK
jgi:predicted RNase H-like nuclease (RuvC/YqgF family)